MAESDEVLVPLQDALPGMQIVNLPDGESAVGDLLLIKLRGESGFGWSMRRTEGLSDEELLGQAVVLVEMLRNKMRFRE